MGGLDGGSGVKGGGSGAGLFVSFSNDMLVVCCRACLLVFVCIIETSRCVQQTAAFLFSHTCWYLVVCATSTRL